MCLCSLVQCAAACDHHCSVLLLVTALLLLVPELRAWQVPEAMQTQGTTGSYNIQTALNHGAYNRFHNAVWKVFGRASPPTADFKLPEVVVVGSESSGKSSLLENITKCEIFPRDRSQCTRAPIRFKLMQVRSWFMARFSGNIRCHSTSI